MNVDTQTSDGAIVISTLAQPAWPRFSELALRSKDHESRRRGLGGSDANVILSGNPVRLLDLWREKTGEKPPEDLSNSLPVALGTWTECFNRQWYEKLTGKAVSRVGESTVASDYPWRRCTLDGFVEVDGAIWEAKHTSAFAKSDEVLERYMPQLQHNMAVLKVERAILSVIFGNQKHEIFEVGADWLYQLDLLEAEQAFWTSVCNGTRPIPIEPPTSPKPIGVREVCLIGNNAWAAAATDWRETRISARRHMNAAAAIKGMVDSDVSRAFGHGIEAKRSRSGALTIRELAE